MNCPQNPWNSNNNFGLILRDIDLISFSDFVCNIFALKPYSCFPTFMTFVEQN